ncbi:MAG: 2-C-methyl-D-erythritol 2,4-cyclodiphosphate synthase [Spirochaetes bacterium]|uniref:2-C-methyl-D-erythritol 2,4-cyclodiphosphate synthase n=1 Tax=Candidatus Ornithospirochaeta stercoravium TaxID=2840897 RepID=A0A9D9ICP5_9SPIO|nr:2-C-methyl-D-erythritol 2,4-cyclodiphosphate synthase [Candidatus Ornithospirochaeta stercoravium]
MRIGIGNDIHRLIEGRPLILGGVEIPYSKGEDAHSDGDVLVHAIIDAILGACAKGDIGTLFPPSDERYKDADSLQLLKQAVEYTGARIINIDSSITLEEPKLRPYITAMRERIAEVLSIDIDRVSIKAKTNEGLDETGKGNAISAIAVVLVEN